MNFHKRHLVIYNQVDILIIIQVQTIIQVQPITIIEQAVTQKVKAAQGIIIQAPMKDLLISTIHLQNKTQARINGVLLQRKKI